MAMAVLSVRAAMPVSSTRAAAAVHTEFYDLLRVGKKASSSQLKTAYRKLALEHHPDVSQHPDANRRFAQLSNAYEVSIVSLFSRSHSFSFSFSFFCGRIFGC
jgi:preprotein translocase subunit Sec63